MINVIFLIILIILFFSLVNQEKVLSLILFPIFHLIDFVKKLKKKKNLPKNQSL